MYFQVHGIMSRVGLVEMCFLVRGDRDIGDS